MTWNTEILGYYRDNAWNRSHKMHEYECIQNDRLLLRCLQLQGVFTKRCTFSNNINDYFCFTSTRISNYMNNVIGAMAHSLLLAQWFKTILQLHTKNVFHPEHLLNSFFQRRSTGNDKLIILWQQFLTGFIRHSATVESSSDYSAHQCRRIAEFLFQDSRSISPVDELKLAFVIHSLGLWVVEQNSVVKCMWCPTDERKGIKSCKSPFQCSGLNWRSVNWINWRLVGVMDVKVKRKCAFEVALIPFHIVWGTYVLQITQSGAKIVIWEDDSIEMANLNSG